MQKLTREEFLDLLHLTSGTFEQVDDDFYGRLLCGRSCKYSQGKACRRSRRCARGEQDAVDDHTLNGGLDSVWRNARSRKLKECVEGSARAIKPTL
jgi:hypothetical protein